MGIAILLCISIASAALWHWFVSTFWAATVAGTLTAVVLFQVGAYLDLGYIDPFIYIALVVSTAIALATSAAVGLAVRHIHRRRSTLSK